MNWLKKRAEDLTCCPNVTREQQEMLSDEDGE